MLLSHILTKVGYVLLADGKLSGPQVSWMLLDNTCLTNNTEDKLCPKCKLNKLAAESQA